MLVARTLCGLELHRQRGWWSWPAYFQGRTHCLMNGHDVAWPALAGSRRSPPCTMTPLRTKPGATPTLKQIHVISYTVTPICISKPTNFAQVFFSLAALETNSSGRADRADFLPQPQPSLWQCRGFVSGRDYAGRRVCASDRTKRRQVRSRGLGATPWDWPAPAGQGACSPMRRRRARPRRGPAVSARDWPALAAKEPCSPTPTIGPLAAQPEAMRGGHTRPGSCRN